MVPGKVSEQNNVQFPHNFVQRAPLHRTWNYNRQGLDPTPLRNIVTHDALPRAQAQYVIIIAQIERGGWPSQDLAALWMTMQ